MHIFRPPAKQISVEKSAEHVNFNLKNPNVDKQPVEVFYKKGVLRNFAKFGEKQPCLRLYFNKVAGLRFQLFLKRDSNTGDFL